MENTIVFGGIGGGIILSILLRMIYNTFTIDNRWKPWIATGIGMLLGILALFIQDLEPNLKNIALYLIQGFMMGATAVGLYEMTKKERKL